MARPQKDPLRPLSEQEKRELQRTVKATSERLDVVRRAKAFLIAAGRGHKPTYTSEQHACILAEVQREPDREKDQTATWSLMTLRTALRKQALPQVARETFRQVVARGGLQLPAHAHLVPHGQCAAQAQERHGDDL
jgi:hypothetical protein